MDARLALPRLATVFLAFAVVVGARAAEDLGNRIEKLLPPHVGAAVLVIDDGATVLKQGYGLRRLGEEVPNDSATNFRLASVTKHITAT